MSNLKNYYFTSESVSEGHPDKVSDRISDMVVDTFISSDPYSRVACETLTTTNKVVLAGEVRGPELQKNDLIEKILTTNKGFIEIKSFKKSNKTIFSSYGNKIFFYFLSIYISLIFFFKIREN